MLKFPKLHFFSLISSHQKHISLFLPFVIFSSVVYFLRFQFLTPPPPPATPSPLQEVLTATPSASSSPKPLTFSEMNILYGPCARLPTLMYHHVQPADLAQSKNQAGLTVNPDIFQNQLDYLKARGYTPIAMADLANFFNAGTPLPAKSVLLTFDDAYADFAGFAAPILQQFGFKATVFTPTGLVENPDYLTWNDITNLAGSSLFLFANHTWSHKNVAASPSVVEHEITTADDQLQGRNLNSPKIFAYPYGIPGNYAKTLLQNLGYQLAFTTKPGSTLCVKQRFDLPRVRIGNSALSNYGL